MHFRFFLSSRAYISRKADHKFYVTICHILQTNFILLHYNQPYSTDYYMRFSLQNFKSILLFVQLHSQPLEVFSFQWIDIKTPTIWFTIAIPKRARHIELLTITGWGVVSYTDCFTRRFFSLTSGEAVCITHHSSSCFCIKTPIFITILLL